MSPIIRAVQARRRLLAVSLAVGAPTVALWLPGCIPDESCEEDPRAQVLDARVMVTVAGAQLEAELAATETARARGWKYRRCDREALWLVPDEAPGPLSVWGCALDEAIDVAFVADGVVVGWSPELAPCGDREASGPIACVGCSLVASPGDVDGVLETPAGQLGLAVGDAVQIEQP